ncbi:lysostaphin resistance A-like protein [Enterococcus sp. AZ109]|uniref:CPBP family intramembrane glutamic endopeptidase n=1 Tax=Enterococcus sp. AZ109 TaxID=2774634 RepID=UPI003F212ECC
MKKSIKIIGGSFLIVALYFIFEYLTLKISQLLYGDSNGSDIFVHRVVGFSIALAAYLLYAYEIRNVHHPVLSKSHEVTFMNFLLVSSALLVGKLSFILVNLFSKGTDIQWLLVDFSAIQASLIRNPVPVSTIILLGLLTPITEEIFFRKLLTESLLSIEVPKSSVYLMVALSCGLIRFSSFSQFIHALTAGLLYGLLYFFTGNLFYSSPLLREPTDADSFLFRNEHFLDQPLFNLRTEYCCVVSHLLNTLP